MSINVSSLEAELQMFIFYQSHKSNIHTDENSKARGYIRNNCETQSTHCRIPLHYLISQNNKGKKKCTILNISIQILLPCQASSGVEI